MKRAFKVVLAASIATLVSVTLAPPAGAAATGSYCFVQTNGHPWGGINTAVQVNSENTNSGWQDVAYTETDGSGCAVFALSGTYQSMYVRAITQYRVGSTLWLGVTPLVGLPGNHHVDLGTGVVRCHTTNPSDPCIPGSS